jgi:RNA polymerase sigma-70 factor (ECF subfamily)
MDRFRDLFERYFGPVSYYFVRLGFSREESHDLAQETFLRAYRGLGGFRGKAHLKAWLFTIAKNVGLNASRAQRTWKRTGREIDLNDLGTESPPGPEEAEEEDRYEIGLSVLPAGGPDPLERLLSEERSQLLHEALNTLPPGMRRSVLLRYGQGLKYPEIADLLRVSIETVKSQLHQARQRLGPLLGTQFAELEPPSRDSRRPSPARKVPPEHFPRVPGHRE